MNAVKLLRISFPRLLVVSLLLLAFPAKAEVEVPEDLQFIFAEWNLMTPAERTARQRQLQETPNIGVRLCDLLWEFYREGSDESLGSVIGALISRDDIPPAQLNKITDEMRRLAGMNIKEVQKMGVLNMLYGVRLLERYPSSEHEDLALLLLNSEDSVIRSNAATTLGRIGTEQSVEPMRKHYDPFRYTKTAPPHEGPQVFEAEQMLLARVAAKSGAATLSVVAMLICATMSLLWLTIKKRS